MFNKALEIAYKAHEGQLDKGGHPYILHPLRVAFKCGIDVTRIIAILHDTVEDTDVTFDYLKEQGFDDIIITSIKHLTKQDGEDYEAFIKRVSEDVFATDVKIYDIEDNLDETRLNGKKHWKKEKYEKALSFLKEKRKEHMENIRKEYFAPMSQEFSKIVNEHFFEMF